MHGESFPQCNHKLDLFRSKYNYMTYDNHGRSTDLWATSM